MNTASPLTIGTGFYFEDLSLGFRFNSRRRTITETDLVGFVNFTWLNEELFTSAEGREELAISGRVVPAALVYCCAEGLVGPAMQHTGLAFLHMELDVKGPTFIGDTIHVEVEVVELRPSRKPDRSLVRTSNKVVNQKGETVLIYTPLRLMRRR